VHHFTCVMDRADALKALDTTSSQKSAVAILKKAKQVITLGYIMGIIIVACVKMIIFNVFDVVCVVV
jgi:hypothetical protein